MAKDQFDNFMSQYNDKTVSLGNILPEMGGYNAKKVEPDTKPTTASSSQITPEQRSQLNKARNVNRGRPATGAKAGNKIRVGFLVNPDLIERFHAVSYKTGIPFGLLHEEAIQDLIDKYEKQ